MVGGGLMLGGILFALLGDILRNTGTWRSMQIAAALVIAIFLYDGVLKRTFAGPILMGTCRFLNILLGLSILDKWPPASGWLLAIVIGAYIAGVTWFTADRGEVEQAADADQGQHRWCSRPCSTPWPTMVITR